MEYKAAVFGSLCSLSAFTINGIDADSCDFVEQFDHNEEDEEDYGCGDMKADVKHSTVDVLNKYKISEGEYQEIAGDVACKLSFGECGWCV